MTDEVIVIRPLTGYLAKTVSKKRITPEAKHLKFKAERIELDNIEELSELLFSIEDDPTAAIIRGHLSVDANPNDHFRRMEGREDGTGCYRARNRRWLMIDIDKLPMSSIGDLDPREQPKEVVEAIVKNMGIMFRETSCHWQFSSSQGFKGGKHISLHLWYWADIECSDEDLAQYIAIMNAHMKISMGLIKDPLDPVLYNPIQLHFTAAPILEGVEDVLPQRSGFRRGSTNSLRLSRIPPFKRGDNFLKCLDKMGDNDEGRGFREPILAASTAFVSEYGKPTLAFKEDFKTAVRRRIDEAPRSDHRRPEEIERYSSDLYLDSIIASAARKFSDNAIRTVAANDLLDRYVYIVPRNQFLDTKTDSYIPVVSMDNNYKWMDKSVSSIMFQTQELKRVDYIQAIPGKQEQIVQEGGASVWNKWRRPQLVPTREEIPEFEDHLSYLFEGYQVECDFFKQWLAHVILRPGVRIRFMPILGGNQGVGKSIFAQLIAAIAGDWNVFPITTQNLKEKFNNYLTAGELIYVDELMAMGRLEIYNAVKPYISEDRVTIREMMTAPYVARARSNWFATTNYRDAMRLDKDERRVWVYFCEQKPRAPEHYARLFEMIKYDPGLFLNWAESIDLTSFNPDAPPPMTKHKIEMHEDSQYHGVLGYLNDALEAGTWPFKCDQIILQDLVNAVGQRFGKFTVQMAANFMRDKGFDQTQCKWKRTDGTEYKPKVWMIRNAEKYNSMATADRQKLYFPPGRLEDQDLDYDY